MGIILSKDEEKRMKKELDEMEEPDTLSDEITKTFEDEGYKQAEYWEYQDDGTIWGVFVDFYLNSISVAIDSDDEYYGDNK